MVRVCFVCLGNICRSPTAEGVMRHLVKVASLDQYIAVESAGTIAYHIGEPPDPRAQDAARARGITLDGRAQHFLRGDWERFDYVVAMDGSNYEDLLKQAPGPVAAAKLSLLRSFDPGSPPQSAVPDPYYGGARGFEYVLDLCESACRGLLQHIRRTHALP